MVDSSKILINVESARRELYIVEDEQFEHLFRK
jgi:hypothetical protein